MNEKKERKKEGKQERGQKASKREITKIYKNKKQKRTDYKCIYRQPLHYQTTILYLIFTSL